MNFSNLIILFALIILIFSSCKPPVVFQEPYPLDGEDLLQFPEIYQGEYLCESDSTLISVFENMIVLKQDRLFRESINNIFEKKDCLIKDDKLFLEEDGRCYPIRYVNDSIVEGRMIEIDTLFLMGKNSKVREYKGNIILSEKFDSDEWAIHILTMDEDFDVLFRAITDESDFNAIQQITPMQDITAPEDKMRRYSIKPTMIQFDEILENKKIFIECDHFIRLDVEEIIPWVF